jgi:hypothetical protein
MRQAKHLHPEWGILALPPRFFRSVRVFLIAAVVGATAGSAVVLALADRAPDQMSVAARTLATASEAAAIQAPSVLTAPVRAPSALPGARAKSASLIETAPTKATLLSALPTKPVDYSTPAQKKANRKHHTGTRYVSRGRQFTSLMDDWYRAVGL